MILINGMLHHVLMNDIPLCVRRIKVEVAFQNLMLNLRVSYANDCATRYGKILIL